MLLRSFRGTAHVVSGAGRLAAAGVLVLSAIVTNQYLLCYAAAIGILLPRTRSRSALLATPRPRIIVATIAMFVWIFGTWQVLQGLGN